MARKDNTRASVEKTVPFGVYLTGENPEEGRVLLPRSQVPEGISEGDELEVFLYKDSEDRPIATCKTPKLQLHEVGWLRVAQVGRIGAFLDWGLDKDLLLPYSEQPRERVREGQEVLVAVYLDKSGRLCATMNVYPYLSTNSPYHTGDQVTGVVYETSGNFGLFVAVDSMYSALVPKREVMRPVRIGEAGRQAGPEPSREGDAPNGPRYGDCAARTAERKRRTGPLGQQ